jgi:DNA-binding transcriptional LysR family regulator
METIPDFAVFVAVIEQGSFSKAADRLGITKSAVSRRVTQLETRLGIQLLKRSTRKLTLTEAGSRYFTHAAEAVHQVQSAEREAALFGNEAIGEIRVLAPMSFGGRHLVPRLPGFLAAHPKLSVDVTLDDHMMNRIDGNFDLALRAGDLPDSAQIVRRIAPLRSVICASPDYVRRHGAPRKPADLATRNCVIFSYSDNRDVWEFRSSLGPESIPVSGNLKVNNSDALCSALAAGGGIGRLPTFVANALLASGELTRLLPEFEMPAKSLHLQFPSRQLIPRATRYLIDYLVEIFDPELPYWDRDIGLEPRPVS